MREYQPETRARQRNAVRTQVGVELLNEHDGQPEPLVPDEGIRVAWWRTRVAIVGLVALVFIAGP